jgi:AcrR family transcriptional regulator
LGKQAKAEAGARARILEAGWDLIVERGLSAASMGQVAEAAGVSRQSVYLHFGSRAGLLVAMARHHDENSPLRAKARAARKEAPPKLLDAYFGSWLDYLCEIFPVAQLLSAASVTDPEAAVAFNDRMASLRAAMAEVMTAISEAGMLRDDWTIEQATDFAWALTHVDSWRHLVVERGWAREEAKRRMLAALQRLLLRESTGSRVTHDPQRSKSNISAPQEGK